MAQGDLPAVINLNEKLSMFSARWTPKIVAQINDYVVKLVKLEDEFVWHSHPETDELFFVVKGKMRIDFRQGGVELGEGDLLVVPRGTEHRPVAEPGCEVMLIEPIGTVNTGNAGGSRTVNEQEWI